MTMCNKLHDFVFSGKIGNELSAAEVKQALTNIGFITSGIHENRVLWYPHFDIVCQKC